MNQLLASFHERIQVCSLLENVEVVSLVDLAEVNCVLLNCIQKVKADIPVSQSIEEVVWILDIDWKPGLQVFNILKCLVDHPRGGTDFFKCIMMLYTIELANNCLACLITKCFVDDFDQVLLIR